MILTPRWFACVGAAISVADRHDAAAILAARGQRTAGADAVVLLPSWRAAAISIDDRAMAECWDDDEDEREALWTRAATDLGESALLALLTAATSAAAPQVRAAAVAAAGAEEAEAVATACASALLALHQYTLAQVAGAPQDHPFMLKYALFARGRWALGYRDGVYGLY
jgi:hypothetical protein